jgi:hypothetical protein
MHASVHNHLNNLVNDEVMSNHIFLLAMYFILICL